jgi:putative sigma-54 modulation protein
MQVNITARHLELTPALAEYVRKKMQKCERIFDHIVWSQVILSVEKTRQIVEIVLHASNHTFRAKEESIDLYSAVDLAVEKMDKQLKKLKEMTKLHRKSKSEVADFKADRVKKQVSTVSRQTGKELIAEVKSFEIKPMSTAEAIDEMELLGFGFYIYFNEGASQINVVYRKKNGTYGLIEPEM